MKQTVLSKWSTMRVCMVLALTLVISELSAQQRYFAVTLVNENDYPNLETIESASEVGCNAVALTIQWGAIHGKMSRITKAEKGDAANLWHQYDVQIAKAVSLGMKVAINIAVSTGDDASNSSSDRYGVNTADGWLKEDRMVVANYDGQEAVMQKYGGAIRPGINLQFVMTSLSAQSTRDRITNFTKEVIQRYNYLQTAGNLLYTNVIFSRQGEGEFEMGSTKYHYNQQLDMGSALADYSGVTASAYRNWLKGKYGTITYLNSAWGTSYSSFDDVHPNKPSNSTFTGPAGTDWFVFRTALLKEVNDIFKDAVKSVNSGIKVISHHGSSYDRLSRGRGTLHFNEIAANLDGIKINDGVEYDHRFALDLLRSNMPGKLYVNEAAYIDNIQTVVRQARESFTHGANVVCIFYLENALQHSGTEEALQDLTDTWVKNKQVTKPTPSNNSSFTLSDMIARDGCTTNRDNYSDDCDAYKNWRNAYNNGGNIPVNIFLNDDVTPQGCFYKDLKLASNGQEVSVMVPNNRDIHVTGNDCRVIATVKGNGLSNGNTPLTASVTIDNDVKNYKGQPLVQRHFYFTPANSNPSEKNVTLYVGQSELSAFNAVSSVKLPKDAADSDNFKNKLRIFQWAGKTMSGTPAIIDPADTAIQWDSVLGLWRITFTVNTVSSFYITAESATPLPVKLVRFSGENIENAVALQWETSEETHSDHFEIEHSESGKIWNLAGRVAASEESAVLQKYTFTHANPSAGENLYRLKMVDQDSTFAYSKIISVSVDGVDKLVLYPNPVVGNHIQLQYAGALPDVTFSDMSGVEIPVVTEKTEHDKLSVRTQSKLNPGLYILTAGYGAKQVRYKVVVVN
ncbi:beta-galactosidase [Dyadobacter sp. CY323]|uniref:beta-galactosidase n=1 Tax=Dyadobacter sp. CY323 TaxID=2907302 RepID=UPI001F2DB761|nr:beta-galactosidase [Dyadobacter sp. CY323]MCE6991553.1 beta-galactosidase [Dyadobacter sp. CY323]